MVDRQRKSCTFFAFERQRWNSNCYMTRPPCEEITQYQREINCRVFGVFFKRTCNTHPWISNEILGSRLRPGIIYSKVCIVKWFPLIKCTLTKRLRHFFFHIISAIAIPQLHFFCFFLALWWRTLNDDCDPKRNWEAHLASTICMAEHRRRALFTISSCVLDSTQTNTKGQRARRPGLSSSDTSLSSCLSTDLLIFQSASCACVCVLSLCVCVFLSVVPQHAEEQRLSQTITPRDGSVLLHSEMKLKCLIDFSFTFLTSGGNISQWMQLQPRGPPPPGLSRGPAFSLWRGGAALYSRHVFFEPKSSGRCGSIGGSIIQSMTRWSVSWMCVCVSE